MATVIRMMRGGRKKAPYYRIVVMDQRDRTRGQQIDFLGVYHPCARPEPVSEVDVTKALHWLKEGAQPSDTAKSVLRKLGVMKHFAEGTSPEEGEETARHTAGVVEDKGYNAPPEPKEEEAPIEEVAAEAEGEEAAADAEGEEAAAEEAPAEEAPAEEAAEEAPAEEEKAE